MLFSLGLAAAGTGAACKGTEKQASVAAAPAAEAAAPAAEAAAPAAEAKDDGPEGHAHGSSDEAANAAGDAPETEKIATARVIELAQTSISKMEELSARAAAAKGNCPELAAALDEFYRDNAAFIEEMNGLDEQMTKLQRRLTEQRFTAPMQRAMAALLEQMMSCRDDPAVAKAFLRLQR